MPRMPTAPTPGRRTLASAAAPNPVAAAAPATPPMALPTPGASPSLVGTALSTSAFDAPGMSTVIRSPGRCASSRLARDVLAAVDAEHVTADPARAGER